MGKGTWHSAAPFLVALIACFSTMAPGNERRAKALVNVATVADSAAGAFNFSSSNYTVTAFESLPGPFTPSLGVANLHDTPGALITVTRTGGARGRVMVDYATVDDFTIPCGSTERPDAAVPNCDYIPTNGTLVFDDYQMSRSFVVPVRGEDLQGFIDKNLSVVLSNPRCAPQEDSATIVPTLGPQTNATVSILQLAAVRAFSFERITYRAEEHGPGAQFDIVLPGGGPGTVRVSTLTGNSYILQAGSDYADSSTATYSNAPSSDGTAPIVNPQDFFRLNTLVGFPTGISRRRISLAIIDDSAVEFNEDIRVQLQPVAGQPPVILGRDEATVTILHDDQPAGAADRDWNPERVSFTAPPFNNSPGANDMVNAVVVQPNQKTLIGGHFTTYNDTPRGRIARINRDGSLDTSFNPGTGANAPVAAVALYSDPNAVSNDTPKIVIGGGFSSYDGMARSGIARLHADGSLDTTFSPGAGANGNIHAVLVLKTGKVLMGGDFTTFNGTQRHGIAQLNNDGSLDTSFDPGQGANAPVWAMVTTDLAPPVNIAVKGAGDYRTATPNKWSAGIVTGAFRPGCVPDALRIYDGMTLIFDTGFTNEYANDLSCQRDWTGPITFVVPFGPGTNEISIVINSGGGGRDDGWSVDATIQGPEDLSIYVAGEFTELNGASRNGIARLHQNGNIDLSFEPGLGADGPVYSLAVEANNGALIAGAFTHVGFDQRNGVARLRPDGALDAGFDPGDGANDPVYSVILQPDGKPLLGGIFTSFDHVRRMGIARLMTNGVVDTSFMDTAYNQFAGLINPFSFDPPNFVNSIALETNGNVIIGGSFTNLGGNANVELSRASASAAWTRQDKAVRFNVARLIGGHTPGPGSVQITSSEYNIPENAGALSTTVSRIDGRLGTISANVSTTDGSAQAGVDYTSASNRLVWNEGSYSAPVSVGFVGSKDFAIPIIDDLSIEEDETLGIMISSQTGSITLGGEYIPLGAARGRIRTPVVIKDEDSPPSLRAGSLQSDGFSMTIYGPAAQHFTIEASADLINWDSLVRLTNYTGTLQYTDPSAVSGGHRFYRALLSH